VTVVAVRAATQIYVDPGRPWADADSGRATDGRAVRNQSVRSTDRRHWAVAACVALVVAAIGDAGPEIIESRSLFAGYDGPGPLIYLGVAATVAAVRWRFMPLLAVVTGALFLFGGFADASFAGRLGTPTDPVPFYAGWLQMAGFAAAVAFGIAAVGRHRSVPAQTAHPDERQDSDMEGDRR
jgi:hypothetical protein